MSIEPKDTTARNPAVSKSSGLPRWARLGTPIAILAIGTTLEAYLWNKHDGDGTLQVLRTGETLLSVVSLLLIWWTFLSGLRWRIRLAGLSLLIFAGLALTLTFRLKEFSGEMVPRFEVRWQPSAEQRTADYWQKQTSAVTTGASRPGNDAVGKKLEIGPSDWPQFNGPHRDGRLDSVRAHTSWEPGQQHKLTDFDRRPPRELWRHPVGPAWSSFAVVDDFAFTQEQRGPDEAVVCYDARTGEQLWVHLDPNQRFENLLTGVGPRATPTVYDSRVYTLGATGILNCLAARTGTVLWSKNAVADAGVEPPPFGLVGSPLVYDDLVVVNPGGPRQTLEGTGTSGRAVVAYDRLTGKEMWQAGDCPAAYASPILATLCGVKQVIVFDALGAAGHDAKDGKQLWRSPVWTNEFHNNAAEPIVLTDAAGESAVFLSSGYGTGSVLFDVKQSGKTWSVSERWRAPNKFKLKFNSAVVRDGALYGLDEGALACLDLATGHQRWKQGRYGYGQILMFANVLFVISEDGDAVFLDVASGNPVEVARFHALDGKTWNHPAYSKGRLYLRNAEEAACYDLEPTQTPWR